MHGVIGLGDDRRFGTLDPGVHGRTDQHHRHEDDGGEPAGPAESLVADGLPFIDLGHMNGRDTGGSGFGELRNFDDRPEDFLYLDGQIVLIQTQQSGVLADEAFGEHTAGQLLVLIVFNGLEKAGGDLQFAGDLLQIEIALHSFAAQGLANGCHKEKFPTSNFII
jgi:hypothetical protein